MMLSARTLRSAALEARFEVLKLVRLPAYALPTLAFPAFFYLFFAVAMNQHQTVANVPLGTYLLATYAAFGVVSAALFGFGVSIAVERGQGWLTLKRASPMPVAAYFGAKVLSAVAFSFAVVVVLSLLAVSLGGARLGIVEWLAMTGTLIAGAIPFCALGLAVGSIAGPNSAPAIVNLVSLPLAFLGGLWIPIQALPPAFARIAEWLPTYHFGQLALGSIGAGTGNMLVHAGVLVAYACAFVALAAYGWRRDEGKLYG